MKFSDFFIYLICCKKKKPNISYIEEYREKIISEETIIKSYLDLYQINSLFQPKENYDMKEQTNNNIDNLDIKNVE